MKLVMLNLVGKVINVSPNLGYHRTHNIIIQLVTIEKVRLI